VIPNTVRLVVVAWVTDRLATPITEVAEVPVAETRVIVPGLNIWFAVQVTEEAAVTNPGLVKLICPLPEVKTIGETPEMEEDVSTELPPTRKEPETSIFVEETFPTLNTDVADVPVALMKVRVAGLNIAFPVQVTEDAAVTNPGLVKDI